MMKLSILLMILFIITGCAGTNNLITAPPLSGHVWEATVISKPYFVPRTKFVSDINDRVNMVDDEYSRDFVLSEINKEVPLSESSVSFYDNMTCQSKMDYLIGNLEPVINNFSSSVNYVGKLVAGIGRWEKRPFATDTSVTTAKLNNDTCQHQFSSDMKWRNHEKSEAAGYVKINVTTKMSCEDKNNTAYFKVNVSDYSIQNPEVGFGQNSTLLSIDWKKIENTLSSIRKEYVFDGEQEYSKMLQRVAQSINRQLEDRFSKLSRETSKSQERIYKVAVDVMASRIQRKLESYKFTTDRTRYEFSNKLAYRGISVDLKTVVKIFPEESGKTSLVFNLEYSPIRDNIAGKMSFGEEEAQKYLREQIESFENLIVSR